MSYTTLITDFDNTLYDWFHMWYRSFSAMLGEVERTSGISEDVLLPEIRAIHQRFGTSEYAFLIENIPSIQAKFKREDLSKVFESAVHAYRRVRIESLKLYPGVSETLINLRSKGVKVVLYTESLAFYTTDRIKRLDLDALIDFVYSPPDHDIPEGMTKHTERSEYQLSHAEHRYLAKGEIKPNPVVLADIIAGIGEIPSRCVYLGDSKMKDVAMAQDAGVADVLAAYGAVQHKEEYELLRKVSHWTEADVQREKNLPPRAVVPSHTINEFSEIAKFFQG